ncbi:MAG: ABC transporter permease [Bacteroidota bacterium]|nr:ABC transporter permease [Bacteroidota bacterium]
MFDRDNWQEIVETIKKNKLRTGLTAFSVAWGIFILIVLLGAGTGLRNGAQSQFGNDAANSIWIEGGTTSLPYKGMKPGRNIQLTNTDFNTLHTDVKDIEYASAVYNRRQNENITYKNEKGTFIIRSCMPEHVMLEKANIIKGRFINKYDIQECRKVCAIGLPVKETLFKDEDPIGKFINAGGTQYKVVGYFHDPGRGDNDRIYVPVSTAQKVYNGKDHVGNIWLSTKTTEPERTTQMEAEIRNTLSHKYNFDPKDLNAVGVFNNTIEYERVMNMLTGIKIFVLIIGILTLIAGMVGVSNIMMIIVKERTKEIGVRKAIGATPASIVGQIIQEAVFITSLSGYIGLVAGIGLIELVKMIGLEGDFFKNPDVDFGMAIWAIVILVIVGAVAGLIPAVKAARVEPVEALRTD